MQTFIKKNTSISIKAVQVNEENSLDIREALTGLKKISLLRHNNGIHTHQPVLTNFISNYSGCWIIIEDDLVWMIDQSGFDQRFDPEPVPTPPVVESTESIKLNEELVVSDTAQTATDKPVRARRPRTVKQPTEQESETS